MRHEEVVWETKLVTHCRICKSDKLTTYLDLGELPLANGLLTSKEQSYPRYPLEVMLCEVCHLSQLSLVVNPKILYSNYPYRSSTSRTFQRHCYDMGASLNRLYHANKLVDFDTAQPTFIDIGANDGCLIRQFKRHGFKPILAVEPDEKMWDYIDKDVPKLNHFWCEKNTHLLNMKANFVIAQNVFAHVDDIRDFLRGANNVMYDWSILVIEIPSARSMVHHHEFDTIYHEHLSYFLLSSLIPLFASEGLDIFKVERFKIHGGTIRIYASREKYPHDGSVELEVETDKHCGMYELATYLAFAKKVVDTKDDLVGLLDRLKGSRILGFGASAKGSTLLNYCGITLPYIIDDTPSKQGKVMPGVMIEIHPYNFADIQTTDYILLLAWNFRDEIITNINASGYKGKWIVPIPEVEVV